MAEAWENNHSPFPFGDASSPGIPCQILPVYTDSLPYTNNRPEDGESDDMISVVDKMQAQFRS